jgi:hypothetical protein
MMDTTIQAIFDQVRYSEKQGRKIDYILVSKGTYKILGKKLKPYRLVNRMRKQSQLPVLKPSIW